MGDRLFLARVISTASSWRAAETTDTVRGWGTALQDVGAFFGMIAFTAVASLISRRVAFLFAFLADDHHGVRVQFADNCYRCLLDASDDGLCSRSSRATRSIFRSCFRRVCEERAWASATTRYVSPARRRFWAHSAASCHSGRLRSRCALSTWSASSRCCGLQRRRASPLPD